MGELVGYGLWRSGKGTVLVSHQEGFAAVFSNRYQVRLEDGVSQVKSLRSRVAHHMHRQSQSWYQAV